MRIESPLQESPFKIGTIVAANTHPFFSIKQNTEILISGESSMLPPLMVVTEVLAESRTLYEESSGMEVLRKGTIQCKCLWFSPKSCQFEDAWISSRLLKLIEGYTPEESATFPFGSSVIFITSPIEIGKRKSSLKQFGSSIDEKNKSITGLMSFTAPVMQVVGTAKSESKEPVTDSRTGLIKRLISKQLVKCKYHNPHSEKYSEVLIAIEALSILTVVDADMIKTLLEFIKDGTLLKTQAFNPLFHETIIKPLTMVNKLGNYYLEVKDYLENKTVEILVENSIEQFKTLDSELEHLPKFKRIGKKLSIVSVKDKYRELSTKQFWRIKYRDNYDNVTTRTIYDIEINFLTELDEDENPRKVEYVKAKCILRNQEERFFRVERIQLLEILPLDWKATLKP